MIPREADAQARRVWSLGAYEQIAPAFLPMAAHLVDAAGVSAGERILDVACGTGNVAVTAARRGAEVTGLDLLPSMLEAARENARIAGTEVTWREGTATALPFPDDAFDAALSCVGHIFATPPAEAARELVRVTRPGGRIAFACWTPSCAIAAMGRLLNGYLPPDPAPPDPPFRWGDPEVAAARLGDGVGELHFETGTLLAPVLSPAHYWEKATRESGLFIAALSRVDESRLPELEREMIEVIGGFFDERRNVMPLEYRIATAVVVRA